MYNFLGQDLFSIQRLYKDVFEKKNTNILLCMDHTIAQLILKKVQNPLFDSFITCHKMSSRLFENTLMKNWKRGSFNIPNPLLVCLNLVC
jgi:hypothetical protein